MNYKDLIDNNVNNGVFNFIAKSKKLEFMKDDTADVVNDFDNLFLFENSNKQLTQAVQSVISGKVVTDYMEQISVMILVKFMDKWNSIYKLDLANLPLNQKSEEIYSGTVKNTGSNDLTSTQTDKTSAYDSDDFVNDNQQEVVNSGTDNNNLNNDYTKTTNDNTLIKENIDLLTNKDLYDIITTDIRNILFITVY